MRVYRIALEAFSGLTASGKAGRWNSQGYEVIYTAESRSLACLELAVHLNSVSTGGNFRLMVIDIPKAAVEKLNVRTLPKGWQLRNEKAYSTCRLAGDKWVDKGSSLALEVPSAIISGESNYLVNVKHPEFKKVKIISVDEFFFDKRIKSS